MQHDDHHLMNITASQRTWMAQLSGCLVSRVFHTHSMARRVIVHLSTCEEHRGQHHFAVFGEGMGVAMSYDGWKCILKTEGVLDQ